jgi:hypothetical protein
LGGSSYLKTGSRLLVNPEDRYLKGRLAFAKRNLAHRLTPFGLAKGESPPVALTQLERSVEF